MAKSSSSKVVKESKANDEGQEEAQGMGAQETQMESTLGANDMAPVLAAMQAEMAKLASQVQAAEAKAEKAQAELNAAKLNLGGNPVATANGKPAWRIPPNPSHIKPGTTMKMPSGSTIVNA